MRPQLLLCGVAVCGLGALFFLLGPIFALPPAALVLTPAAGPSGTLVTATGSGLPAGTGVYLYWQEEAPGNETFYFLGSAQVANGGGLEAFTFQAPQAPSGLHNVTVSSVGLGPTTGAIPSEYELGVAEFNLTSSAVTQSPTSAAGGPSPLDTWGGISVAAGGLLIAMSFVVKERKGVIEAPPGHRFCPFCSNPVALGEERCPVCNGQQPKEGE